jgi:hypothetical protein
VHAALAQSKGKKLLRRLARAGATAGDLVKGCEETKRSPAIRGYAASALLTMTVESSVCCPPASFLLTRPGYPAEARPAVSSS